MNTQVFPRNKAAFIKINKCSRFPTKVFAAPLCSHQHILYRGSRGRRAYAVLVTELLLADDDEEEDEGNERDGEGGAPRETSLASGAACISTVVVSVASALNCKPHFYVSYSSCLLPRALTLASPLSHHSNGAGPASSAAGYRKAEDEMSGTTSQADPIDATARTVLLNRAQTTKFCDNHVR